MKKRNIGILIVMLMAVCGNTFGQGAKSLVFNEVMVNNTSNFQDDYGLHQPWIEIFNKSYASVDIRSCFLTNNRAVLDPNMSVPDRVTLMYPIPKGDVKTKIPARQHLLFWADNMPQRGTFHTSFTLDSIQSNWIALYDANGYTLLDSVTIPALKANCSYALILDGVKNMGWTVKGIPGGGYVTPDTNNKTLDTNEKIDGFKRQDQYGVGMAIMAMLVVFSGLILLYVSFKIVGNIALSLAKKNAMKAQGITNKKEAKEKSIGEEEGEIFAAIAMALHEYQDNVHDLEETILTINKVKRNYSPWSSKIYTLRQTPNR